MLTIRWTLDQEGRLVMTFVRLNTPHSRFVYAETQQAIQKNTLSRNVSAPSGMTTHIRLTAQTPDAQSDRSMAVPSIVECNSQGVCC
jgi:hypothetical protein